MRNINSVHRLHALTLYESVALASNQWRLSTHAFLADLPHRIWDRRLRCKPILFPQWFLSAPTHRKSRQKEKARVRVTLSGSLAQKIPGFRRGRCSDVRA